jgi:DNA processing protein
LGELLSTDECSISVVGSRNYTEYGRIATEKIVTDLAKNNITIISGMARGIDTYAHTTALNNNARTIAILGSGVNVIYPTINTELYHKIIKNGAVISEFLPNTKPYSWNFPTRNRIISGISLGTLVIEASIKSGTMTTANWASDQGKNVYAIPGNIFSEQSKGTNKLISEGAKLVNTATDILEDLHGIIKYELESINIPKLQTEEKIVFDLISSSPISVYEISFKSCLPISKLNSVLTILELNGYIKKLAGDNFIRESKYIVL